MGDHQGPGGTSVALDMQPHSPRNATVKGPKQQTSNEYLASQVTKNKKILQYVLGGGTPCIIILPMEFTFAVWESFRLLVNSRCNFDKLCQFVIRNITFKLNDHKLECMFNSTFIYLYSFRPTRQLYY